MQVQMATDTKIAQCADQGLPLAAMQVQTGKSETAVTAALLRWLRRTGRQDISPWVQPTLAAQIATALEAPKPPTMTQLAADLQLPLWAIRLTAAARWNALHPVQTLPAVPLGADGTPDLARLLADRWPLPALVRATGLHPSTLQGHIAQFLAGQPQPDAAPWLTDSEVARVNALLDGPNPWHTLRRAQARGETTRGQLAIVLALRGQWRPRPVGKRVPLAANHGKAWSRAEDVVVGASWQAQTPLEALSAALARSPEAVLVRARHLGLLASEAPWPG